MPETPNPNHPKSAPAAAEEDDQVVNPWQVSAEGGKIDYDKLIDRFGCQRLNQSLVQRVERLTSLPSHAFLRRGVFFAHRDFNLILDAYERGEKFFLYTGRGPSSEALRLGHLVPFMFTKQWGYLALLVRIILERSVFQLFRLSLPSLGHFHISSLAMIISIA